MPTAEPAAIANADLELPRPPSALSKGELTEAFHLFNQATERFSETYNALACRIRELDLQLANSNAELKRNLAEKERVKDYLATILAALPVGVVVADERGRVKTVNPAAREMLGLDEADVVGRDLRDALKSLGDIGALTDALSGEGHSGRVEIRLTRDGGELREIEAIPLGASQERRDSFGAVIVFHDVTQLKRLEQRAATVSRLTAMGEMAMNVAHEIRNPLGSIELFASALARDLVDRPRQRQLAEHISGGVRSIESIVENILQFHRPRRVVPSVLDAAEVVRESLCYASHLLQQRGIEIVWLSGDETCGVLGDRELLKQVFLNLVLNSAQAMEDGGALEIRIGQDVDSGIIQLSDNGPGIPVELLPKVFDPFITTRPKGTGLGLTIVHNIVTAHGGAIEIANRLGGGARVTVELPLAGRNGSAASADEEIHDVGK